jgi:hypothetical protein
MLLIPPFAQPLATITLHFFYGVLDLFTLDTLSKWVHPIGVHFFHLE